MDNVDNMDYVDRQATEKERSRRRFLLIGADVLAKMGSDSVIPSKLLNLLGKLPDGTPDASGFLTSGNLEFRKLDQIPSFRQSY